MESFTNDVKAMPRLISDFVSLLRWLWVWRARGDDTIRSTGAVEGPARDIRGAPVDLRGPRFLTHDQLPLNDGLFLLYQSSMIFPEKTFLCKNCVIIGVRIRADLLDTCSLFVVKKSFNGKIFVQCRAYKLCYNVMLIDVLYLE